MDKIPLFENNILRLIIAKNKYMNSPKKWKMILLVWCGIYPCITLLSLTVVPLLKNFPIYLKTLVMTMILVPIMVLVIIPYIHKHFHDWLRK